jgi:lipopolysaccharide transport system ATP-binding protein
MATIQALCQRVIQFKGGKIVRSGKARDVISSYLSEQLELAYVDLDERTDRDGSGNIRLNTIHFEDVAGNVIDRAQSGQPLNIVLRYTAPQVANHVSFEVSFYNTSASGVPIFRCSTLYAGLALQQVRGSGEITCRIPKILLPASNYHLNVSAIEADMGYADYVAAAATLQVVDGDVFGSGRVQSAGDAEAILEHSWQISHTGQDDHVPMQAAL